ncbi:fumarylacetoacetate hydrolase family protein [Paraferrimonas sp. SM1919]|uniref:fumarylacetoacetate hydrolase family protein n=1 Tax=Paraferrimonas sp. SM1919 TaxID=2662263 RepID=UPI001F0903D2|nr:fumarylacetoacetate hydrolase family protein [Paraferrimonas sp. SM1919]
MPKIICIGRNYLEHIKELNNLVPEQTVIFCKPMSSAADTLISQFNGEACHYETELCFKISDGEITQAGLGLDLTLRQTQASLKSKGLPWERAKAFNGSALFTDFVEISSLSDFSFTLTVDNVVKQQGHSHMMMLTPSQIVSEIKTFMTLEDGDIIMTGTPAGVGEVEIGKQYTVELKQHDKPLLRHSWISQ